MPTTDWEGILTIDNVQEVADRIRKLLEGKKYTFVTVNELRGFKPRVHTGQRLRKSSDAVSIHTDGQARAGFNVLDTHSAWGCTTNLIEGTFDPEIHICFEQNNRDGDRMMITRQTEGGPKFFWVAAVEPD